MFNLTTFDKDRNLVFLTFVQKFVTSVTSNDLETNVHEKLTFRASFFMYNLTTFDKDRNSTFVTSDRHFLTLGDLE